MRGRAWIVQVGLMGHRRPYGQDGKKREEGALSRGVQAPVGAAKDKEGDSP